MSFWTSSVSLCPHFYYNRIWYRHWNFWRASWQNLWQVLSCW